MQSNKWSRLVFSLILVLLTAFVWPLQSALAQDQEPQIRITQVDNSNFPQVTVYVSVTNAAGEPVGVSPDQIQLFENGQLMQLQDISGGGQGDIGPLTTLLVIDISGSMNNGGKLEAAKQAATAYVEQMRPGDQAGLMTFNTKVNYLQPLTTDHQVLESAINSLKAQGDTAMYDALDQGVQVLQGLPGRKAIIALTDGLDNRSQATAEQVIQTIGPSGLSISTIGLGDPQQAGSNFGLDEAALKSLAQQAGGVYGFAQDPNALSALYELYGRTLQSEYRLTYISPSNLRDGINRTLTVSLTGQAATAAQAQANYNPGGVLPETSGRSWVLFGGILAGLVVLLLIPSGIGLVTRGKSGSKKKPRIKLK